MSQNCTHRLSIHGLSTVIHNHLPALDPVMRRMFGEFESSSHSSNGGLSATEGTIKPYDKNEVMRHLSATAVAISTPRDAMEIYQDNERFWLIDDRWGLAEINLLKGQWRCWLLDEPAMPRERVVEQAVLWPLAQLLRGKGLCMLPAAAVARGELGMLLISPFSVESELSAMLRAGFRLIGQSWCALRDDDGQLTMLHMPGRVQRLNRIGAGPSSIGDDGWVDLESEYCGSAIRSAQCTQVVLVEPGRRPTPQLRSIPRSNALPALRRAWSIAELHPYRVNGGQMPAKLSHRCDVYAARLSQRPQDLLDLLQSTGLTASTTTPMRARALPATQSVAV